MTRIAVAAAVCALAACRAPWTVVPIDAQAAGPRAFDPAAYAASVWSKAVVAANSAPRISGVQGFDKPSLVRDEGKAVRIDTARQRIAVDLRPYDGKPDLEIAFGQIHGTALRDALPFIQFSQFINQVDYARASNALNDRAAKEGEKLGAIPPGSEFAFEGAMSAAPGELPQVTPILVTLRGGAQ